MVASVDRKEFRKVPMPPDLKREIELTENARTVLRKRYLRKGEDGKPVEDEAEMFWRVAYHVALAERDLGGGEAEVETWARQYYDLLTTLRFFPNSPTFTGAGTPLGQLAACFTAEMRVTTDKGVKRIAELAVGDRVLTHQGRYRPVMETYQRAYDGELLSIKIKLIGTTLEVTPEHPILTPSGWVKAGELKVGDKVAVGTAVGVSAAPQFDLAESVYADELELQIADEAIRVRRPSSYQNSGRQANWSNRFIDVTPDLARLCGYYVAEGTLGSDERYVRFTFNKDEVSYHEEIVSLFDTIFAAPVNSTPSNHGNWINLNVYNRAIVAWFRDQFGTGSNHKRLPVWLQYADEEIQTEFLVGLMRGDGVYFERPYQTSRNKTPYITRALRLTLANPGLIQQVWQMCLRLGYNTAIRTVDTTYVTPNANETAQIGFPPLTSRELVEKAFGITLPAPNPKYVRNYVHRIDGDIYFDIEQIEGQPFNGIVYNCEVDEDHSYITEGVVVHNCFVLAIEDDMGRTGQGIFETLRNAALIQQTGGGNGFSFSRLRPKGAIVKSSNGAATGPVGFLRVYDQAFGEIAQGGSRRGANMAVLRVDHPDVREFIKCKTVEGAIENFNISVGITDEFMRAVEGDGMFDLINPQNGSVWETVRAREIFDLIVQHAYQNGEPGVLFLDAANRENPVPHLYDLESTNPCVTGDTLVATPSGWKRADEFQEGDELCTVLGTGQVASIEVHEAVPVYEVTFSDGGTLRVTAAHQFHVRDSQTKFFTPHRLDELKKGDWVRVFRSTVPNNPVPQGNINLEDQDYGFLVGVLIGDGCYTPRGLSKNIVRVSTNADEEEWNAILESTFSKIGSESVASYINKGSRSMMLDPKPGRIVADWVKSIPLIPAIGREKTIPQDFINSNREFLLGLIDGLFSTDGSVDLSSNHPLVRFHTSSKELAQQVRLILLMFGIHGRVFETIRKRHEIDGREIRYDNPKYDLVVLGESFGRFFEQITLSHPDKQYRMEEAALKCNFTGGNWAAKVVSIKPIGIEKVYDLYEPRSDTWITNGYVSRGCGEQFLGPNENCCLGSINLAQHVTNDGRVDWEKLEQSVDLSTRFLDHVVTANAYVPAVPQLRIAAENVRRIGLGIMGLGDMMYALGVRYGSRDGQEFASQIMEFVRYHSMKTSIELARQKGAFPAIEGSRYDPDDLKWTIPQPLVEHVTNWERPALDWQQISSDLKRYGIRNGAQTTVAPTGTISTVSGCEGYGCEPVFALAYVRYVVNTAGNSDDRQELQYTSPQFEQALLKANLSPEAMTRIIKEVNETGTCQHILEVPDEIRRVFVVAGDITAEEHIRMQAAMQAWTDNALSKTCNFPPDATEADVAQAYMLGWELGCKGLTVYVTGSREKVVLETKATKEQKEAKSATPVEAPAKVEQTLLFNEEKKPRPRSLDGKTYRVETPAGTAHIVINENGHGDGQPFEVFIMTAKAGSEVMAVSEAMGRLISYILRIASPVSPRKRMKEVVRQLMGIGGERTMGFGPNRVRSLPDGMAQVFQEYIDESLEEGTESPTPRVKVHQPELPLLGHSQTKKQPLGDICPSCGSATLVNEEGCKKCYSCSYSQC